MIASSDENVSSTFVNRTLCAVMGKVTTSEAKSSPSSLVNGLPSSVILTDLAADCFILLRL